MWKTKMERASIGFFPTPLEPLTQLTAELGGPELWIKRDDQTGLATGGNKTRKLEFLIGDALAQGADGVMTCGAAQSNHARQTAAAAAKAGLACTLVLRGGEPAKTQGNLLLDRLLGADVVWAGDEPLLEKMERVAEELRAQGRRPYVITYGGSDPVGATGYVVAMEELLAQCAEREISFDHIVFATSSGGTQAGLVVGARALGFTGRVLGISIDLKVEPLRSSLAALATATAEYLGLDFTFGPDDLDVEDGYLGGGYGVMGELEREAIRTMASAEGILLDPVYTGRAFGGLMDLIRRGALEPQERVLFWHTGGTTAVFAYADELSAT